MRIKSVPRAGILGFLVLLAGLIWACGGAEAPAATSAPAPQATSAPAAAGSTSAPAATAAPAPKSTSPPPAAAGGGAPKGILRVGVPELGPPQFVLYNQGFEQFKFDGIVTHEPMFR